MRVAVVGHVEWVEFARVGHVPRAGEVVHAAATWEEAAGGGAVVAVQLARLAGRATLFTALGDDELGRRAAARLAALGVEVHAALRSQPTRRALTFVDDNGERTITTLGERLAPSADDDLPWELLGHTDAVFFTAGDGPALRRARAARVLVATPRARAHADPPVPLDALVYSAGDPVELAAAELLAPATALLVVTRGADGGTWTRPATGEHGDWAAAGLPGEPQDTYGCGDSFAAGLTYGLAAHTPTTDARRAGYGPAAHTTTDAGRPGAEAAHTTTDARRPGAEVDQATIAAAVALGARCGAICLTGRGPYGRQVTLTTTAPEIAPGPSVSR